MRIHKHSVLLAAVLLTASCTAAALPAGFAVCAEEQTEKRWQDFKYTEEDGGIVISGVTFSVNDERKSLTVPAQIDGKPVTEIGASAFFSDACMELTEIILPDSLKRIGGNAFSGCWSLKSITLPDGLEIIGSSAFQRCLCESITIPDSVKEIGLSAFSQCRNLKEIKLPEQVTVIPWNAFLNCEALETVQLSPKTEQIGRNAFGSCKALKTINMPDTLISVYTGALKDTPWFAAKQAENPLVCSDGGVLLIDGTACKGEVVIPDTVQRISEQAFDQNENITGVTMSDSVTQIGPAAFFGCSALKSVKLSAKITDIPDLLFNRCGLEEYTFPSTVRTIGTGVFLTCKSLRSVTIPEGVTKVGDCLFLECEALEELSLPASLTDIGLQIAAETPWLAKQHEKDGAYVIVNHCLLDAKGLTGSVTVPDGIKRICGGAFLENEGLTDVVVPASVEYIGTGAFYGCEELHSLTVLNPECVFSEPTEEDGSFADITVVPKDYSGMLRGAADSAVKNYAEKYQLKFDEADCGDTDGDCFVTIADAQLVLREYTNSVAGNPSKFTAEQKQHSDVNGDSAVTVEDAQLILKYYVNNTVAGNTVLWKELLGK